MKIEGFVRSSSSGVVTALTNRTENCLVTFGNGESIEHSVTLLMTLSQLFLIR